MIDPSYELIMQGAEGKIYRTSYLGKTVLVKERFKKSYRHPDLDNLLTKERIKSESRLIVRSKSAGVKTPAIYLVDFERRIIIMEYFEKNVTLKKYISERCEGDVKAVQMLGKLIGSTVAKLHSNNIIHGDLTTSNMLLIPKNGTEVTEWCAKISLDNSDLVMIDFGLSHINASPEDKGVDLYVLERALLSTHSEVGEVLKKSFLSAYTKESKSSSIKTVLEKYEEVRARGRKRTMVG